MTTPSIDDLRRLAAGHGIDALGVARAEVFASTRDDLTARKARGLAADMQFTYRNPERSTDPSRTLPDARSLLVGAMSYLCDAGEPALENGPLGSVARYVWDDHYVRLRRGLEALAGVLGDHGWQARVLVDDNALVDREAAYRAGLGWYGKNANILLPGSGSWFVLGSVLTDAPFAPAQPLADGCGPCDRCLSSCPTGAIVVPGTIDARRCLAWLVQAKGVFPAEHREALGSRVYGCDDCQEVCPPNRRQARQPVALSERPPRPWVPLLDMLDAGDDALMAAYGEWYIPGREARYLRRNALVALGNSAAPQAQVTAVLRRYLRHTDPMLRAHAVWAAKRLGIELPHALIGDTDPLVQAEMARSVTVGRAGEPPLEVPRQGPAGRRLG